MPEKPTGYGFIIQSILIVGISFATIRAGQLAGTRFHSLEIPYAGELGFVVGATFAFTVIAGLYRGYGAYQDNKLGVQRH
jgi:hypothetical protein